MWPHWRTIFAFSMTKIYDESGERVSLILKNAEYNELEEKVRYKIRGANANRKIVREVLPLSCSIMKKMDLSCSAFSVFAKT